MGEIIRQAIYYDTQKYSHMFEDPDSSLGQTLNSIIYFCILLGVVVIILETVPSLESRFRNEFFYIDIAVGVVFACEYLYRFFTARKKLSFVFKPFNIIDLLSFFPYFLGFFFPLLSGYDYLRVLRLVRVLRLFEFSSHSPIIQGFVQALKQYKVEYQSVLGICTSALIVICTFTYYAEHGANSEFGSIPDSLWWGIVTMATVGYGDIVPITPMGKALGAVLILFGPVLLAVISSITILVFMDVAASQKDLKNKICIACKTRNPVDANFCSHCGGKTFSETTHKRHGLLGMIRHHEE